MILLLSTLALAAPSWIGDDPDVSASRAISAPPEVVYSWLLDLNNYASLLPEECVLSWAPGPTTEGEGATGEMQFDLGWVNPMVQPTYTHLAPHRNIDVDHLGPRGFISRFLIEPTQSGSRVEFRTFINPPGIPFRKAYWTRVRPRWTACQADALERLEREVAGLAPAPPAQ